MKLVCVDPGMCRPCNASSNLLLIYPFYARVGSLFPYPCHDRCSIISILCCLYAFTCIPMHCTAMSVKIRRAYGYLASSLSPTLSFVCAAVLPTLVFGHITDKRTPSRPLGEVKLGRARSVVRWVTTCEALVLKALQPFCTLPMAWTSLFTLLTLIERSIAILLFASSCSVMHSIPPAQTLYHFYTHTTLSCSGIDQWYSRSNREHPHSIQHTSFTQELPDMDEEVAATQA